jgi:hypothetical protein
MYLAAECDAEASIDIDGETLDEIRDELALKGLTRGR